MIVYISAEIDLGDIDEEELLEEVRSRGYTVIESEATQLEQDLEEIRTRMLLGQPYDNLLKQYIWNALGKMV